MNIVILKYHHPCTGKMAPISAYKEGAKELLDNVIKALNEADIQTARLETEVMEVQDIEVGENMALSFREVEEAMEKEPKHMY